MIEWWDGLGLEIPPPFISLCASANSSFPRWEPEQVPRSNTGGMTMLQVAQLTIRWETEARQARNLKKAAFHVFSSLAANDEDIRKRLIGNLL